MINEYVVPALKTAALNCGQSESNTRASQCQRKCQNSATAMPTARLPLQFTAHINNLPTESNGSVELYYMKYLKVLDLELREYICSIYNMEL